MLSDLLVHLIYSVRRASELRVSLYLNQVLCTLLVSMHTIWRGRKGETHVCLIKEEEKED